jgi:iron complex outermembrane recepter protein
MVIRSRKSTKMYGLLLVGLLAATDGAPAVAGEIHHFNIAKVNAASAIHEFGVQSGVQILAAGEEINGKRFNNVSGDLSVDEGLRLLLAGSGLTHRYVGDRAVALVAAQDAGGANSLATETSPNANAAGPSPSNAAERNAVVELDEVVVVGSYIRGIDRPVGAELITFTRDDIDRTGFATAQDVIRTLPQVFGGGINEDTINANLARESQTNVNKGSAINLRGLGAASTLVLVNGRRIAPGGFEGIFTDVSNIPLSAVDRIEILPDGASALYGSDAVGGVINFKLRKDYEGAETQARIGQVTDGNTKEIQASQLFGQSWSSGNALVSLEYYKRDNLASTARLEQTNSNQTANGGANLDWNFSSPGTLTSGGVTYAIPRAQDGTALTPASFNGLANTRNTSNRNLYTDVLPEQERMSALITLQQDVTDRLKLFADMLYTQRDVEFRTANVGTFAVTPMNPFYVNPMGGTAPVSVAYDFTPEFGERIVVSEVETSNITLGGSVDVGGNWQIGTYLTRAEQKEERPDYAITLGTAFTTALNDPNRATAFNPFSDGGNTNPATIQAIRDGALNQLRESETELRMASLRADGPLFGLPAGDVKFAIGGEYREDSLQSMQVQSLAITTRTDTERDVSSGYAELFIPVVGEANRFAGFHRMELTAAGRYEDYSDFGGAFVPRAGLTWWPVSAFSIKGTWSESFRAPSLADLDPSNNSAGITPVRNDPNSNTTVMALIVAGKNPNLQEETADIWTAGLQFAPPSMPKLSVGVTYFDIDFTNRIEGINATGALLDPTLGVAVNFTPTAAQRQAACSSPTLIATTPDNCLNQPITALIDGRLLNVASVQTNGIDLLANYGIDTGLGSFDFGFNTTYLLEYSKALTPASPLTDLVDTQNNPPDVRARASFGWRRNSLGTTLYVNYTDGYQDMLSVPNRKVDSWTTLDLNLSYSFASMGSPILAGTQVFLSAQNLLDEDAPYFNNPSAGGYDPENADLIGRRVSLFLRKEW